MTEELIRVLMVDDDQDDYVLVRDMLTAAGFQFCLDWVDTFDAALQTIRRAEHQAYLFDLFLGVPDGLELLRAALADGCEAPIIMLTGLGNRRVDMQAMQAGAADFLDKGQLSPQLLERSIRYAIERKRVEGLLRAQRDLGFSARAARGLDETLRLCLETAIDLTKMDCGGVYLVDEASGDVKLAHHTGFGTSFVKHVSRYEADSARARLVRAGQSIYQRNQDLDGPAGTLVRAEGLRSLAIVPVRYQERVIGCLNVASHTLNEVPDFAHTVFETLVTQIGNAIVQSQAEAALRQSQADLQTLFDTVDDFLIVLDMRGRILQVNHVLLQRLGYSQAELVGESMLKLRSPDRHDEAAAILKDMLAGIADGCSIPLMTSEGVQIPVETRIARGHWDNQPALFGISRDITHQVRAEQERVRLLDGLREQVKLIHQIMDAVPEGVFLLDTRARIIIANPAAREHLHAIANVRV